MEAPCEHGSTINITTTELDVCPQCVEMGSTWVNLRMCTECGQVGCCDNSPNTHATKHHHETKHPIIRSIMPHDTWYWCYPDEKLFEPGE